MASLLREIASRYRDRIIIFDSPPLLATTEARVLATNMGQIVMVVAADATSQHAVEPGAGDDRRLRDRADGPQQGEPNRRRHLLWLLRGRRGELARTSPDARRRNLACSVIVSRRNPAARLAQAVVAGAELAVVGAPSTPPRADVAIDAVRLVGIDAYRQRQSRARRSRKADWVNQFTPALRFAGKSAHTRSRGQYLAADICSTRGRRRTITSRRRSPSAGNVEAHREVPFHRRCRPTFRSSTSRRSARCRTTSRTPPTTGTRRSPTALSPYIRGLLPQQSSTTSCATATSGRSAMASAARAAMLVRQSTRRGHITRQATPLGWSLSIRPVRAASSQNQPSETTADRARAVRSIGPTRRSSFPPTRRLRKQRSAARRGEGVDLRRWRHLASDRPNERRREAGSTGSSARRTTSLFDHRTPLSVWSIQCVARHHELSAAACEPAGRRQRSRTAEFAAAVEGSRCRAAPALVDQIIRERGLPATLTAPGHAAVAADHAASNSDGDVRHPWRAQQHSLQRLITSPDEPVAGAELSEINGSC